MAAFEFTIHKFGANDTPNIANAPSIVRIRTKVIRYASAQVTGRLVLHPSQPDLECSLLQWIGTRSELRHTLVDEEYASQNLVFLVKPIAHWRVFKSTLSSSTMVFCTDALPVMEDISRLDGNGSVPVAP